MSESLTGQMVHDQEERLQGSTEVECRNRAAGPHNVGRTTACVCQHVYSRSQVTQRLQGKLSSTSRRMTSVWRAVRDSLPSTTKLSYTGEAMKDLDEIYADTWGRRDVMLGGVMYRDYLQSEHWASVKKKARSRPNYKKCECCDSQDIELHHTSYKWINSPNELRTIVALCRTHHQEVHDVAKATGVSVRLATNQIRLKYHPKWQEKHRVSSG